MSVTTTHGVTLEQSATHFMPMPQHQVRKPLIFLDFEFTSLDYVRTKVISVQFQTERQDNITVKDLRHQSDDYIHGYLSAIVKNHTVVAHNANAELHILARYGVIHNDVFDTMLATACYEGRAAMAGGSLKDAIHKYAKHLDALVNKEVRNVFPNMDQHPEDWNRPFTEEELTYMRLDVESLREVYEELQRRLSQPQNAKVRKVVELENKLCPVVVAMENRGIYVDKDKWQGIIDNATKERERIKDALHEFLLPSWLELKRKEWEEENKTLLEWLALKEEYEKFLRGNYEAQGYNLAEKWGVYKTQNMGMWRTEHPRPKHTTQAMEEFNLDSHVQLKEAFQAAFGIELVATSAKDLEEVVSTNDSANETIALLLDYKGYTKLISAFGDSILECIGEDSRIHAHFMQMGTDTGRFSCNSPNLQQLPKPRKSADLRSCIVAPQGYKLLTSDLSNAELRILADISGDASLLDIFARGVDMHSAVARMMFKLREDQDPKNLYLKDGVSYRFASKSISFGLVYGMGVSKLASTLGVDNDTAKDLMNSFFEQFPSIKSYLDTQARLGVERRYSETVLGRRRVYKFPPLPNNIRMWEGKAIWMGKQDEVGREFKQFISMVQRLAKNTPIQGSCADIAKLALVEMHEMFNYYSLDAHLVLTVHDEFVCEAVESDIQAAKTIMENALWKSFNHLHPKVAFPTPQVVESLTWEH